MIRFRSLEINLFKVSTFKKHCKTEFMKKLIPWFLYPTARLILGWEAILSILQRGKTVAADTSRSKCNFMGVKVHWIHWLCREGKNLVCVAC